MHRTLIIPLNQTEFRGNESTTTKDLMDLNAIQQEVDLVTRDS